jgi:hypothetical protein
MKKYAILILSVLLSTGCNSNENKDNEADIGKSDEIVAQAPEGNWKVNKEFDEEGNLMRYDSIYTWSSGIDLENLATLDRDSTLKSLQSKFYRNFSQFDFDKEGFGDLFAEDSLFTKRFFNNDFFENDFGKDFMDLEKMHERMVAMQKQFLDRYQPLIEPEKDTVSQD